MKPSAGAFSCSQETLQKKEKCDSIVKRIREFADHMDEVARILMKIRMEMNLVMSEIYAGSRHCRIFDPCKALF